MGTAFPRVFDPRRRRAAFSAGLSIGSPDRKSAGTSGVLEMPVIIGEPSGIRTLRPLIKSWERQSTAALIISSTLMPTFYRRTLPDSPALAMS